MQNQLFVEKCVKKLNRVKMPNFLKNVLKLLIGGHMVRKKN